MQSWLEGRIWVGKGAQAQGWLQAWEYCQAKLIQTLVRASQGVDWSWSQCIKSHHAQTSSGKGYQATSEPETTSEASYLGCGEKELSGPKPSFQMKVNFAFHLETWSRVWRKSGEAQNPCCLKSSVKFPQSVMIWAAMSSAVFESTVFSEVHSQCSHLPGNFRALHASFCWQALWRCWFHFPAGLGTCPHCQRYQKLVQWPWCYCAWLASKLAWPEPHRESMGIVKRKMRETRPNNADELKATVKEPGLPYHLSSATNWSPPCHAELRQ